MTTKTRGQSSLFLIVIVKYQLSLQRQNSTEKPIVAQDFVYETYFGTYLVGFVSCPFERFIHQKWL